ncbi:hypothetical protein SGPA1_20567 [Streptomyces misionensis JCM 4497]
MFRYSSQEPSQAPAGSSVLGALVVPTTIGPPPASPSDSSPQPAASVTDDMDAIAATLRRNRFRLNTRALLDPPYQGRQTLPQRKHPQPPLKQGELIDFWMTSLSVSQASAVRFPGRRSVRNPAPGKRLRRRP